MVYLILLGVLFFMQLLAASWYDLAKKATDTKKAFKHKMICSGTCLASVLLCVAINGDYLCTYSALFTGATFMFFLHDILEEKTSKVLQIISSCLCFCAHIALTVALITKSTQLFGDGLLSSEIRFAILAGTGIICILTEIKNSKLPQFISSAYMLINAAIFGVSLQNSGDAKMQAASCAVIMGALSLAVSGTLTAFDKNNKKSLLRINLYYFGIMFISCSVAVL